MRVAGLFAGIGGLELGLSAAGCEAIFFSEVWEPARSVLSARFDADNAGDIREIKSLPRGIELVTAGFPCQDLSQAGKTAGIGGAKSGLVDSVFRLIDKSPVPWVLLENVSFMLSLDGGRGMRRVVEAFEERGYRWAYRVVNSLSWLPQRRERVFFLASRVGDPATVLLTDEVEVVAPATTLRTHAHGFYWTEGIRGLGWGADCVPTLKNGSTIGIPSPPAILLPSGEVVTPDIRDAERLQGFPVDWTAPAAESGRASWRWSLVGNAVTVPAAKWLGKRLLSPRAYETGRDVALSKNARWPRAARFDGVSRYAVEINDRPERARRQPLQAFLKFQGRPLSERATAGFLERTRRSSLRFPPGFIFAIENHLAYLRGERTPHSSDDLPLFAA